MVGLDSVKSEASLDFVSVDFAYGRVGLDFVKSVVSLDFVSVDLASGEIETRLRLVPFYSIFSWTDLLSPVCPRLSSLSLLRSGYKALRAVALIY